MIFKANPTDKIIHWLRVFKITVETFAWEEMELAYVHK